MSSPRKPNSTKRPREDLVTIEEVSSSQEEETKPARRTTSYTASASSSFTSSRTYAQAPSSATKTQTHTSSSSSRTSTQASSSSSSSSNSFFSRTPINFNARTTATLNEIKPAFQNAIKKLFETAKEKYPKATEKKLVINIISLLGKVYESEYENASDLLNILLDYAYTKMKNTIWYLGMSKCEKLLTSLSTEANKLAAAIEQADGDITSVSSLLETQFAQIQTFCPDNAAEFTLGLMYKLGAITTEQFSMTLGLILINTAKEFRYPLALAWRHDSAITSTYQVRI